MTTEPNNPIVELMIMGNRADDKVLIAAHDGEISESDAALLVLRYGSIITAEPEFRRRTFFDTRDKSIRLVPIGVA
jgi:hypothetical protein